MLTGGDGTQCLCPLGSVAGLPWDLTIYRSTPGHALARSSLKQRAHATCVMYHILLFVSSSTLLTFQFFCPMFDRLTCYTGCYCELSIQVNTSMALSKKQMINSPQALTCSDKMKTVTQACLILI